MLFEATVNKEERRAVRVIDVLPPATQREVLRIASHRAGGASAIREIRIRRAAVCEMIVGDERITLCSRPTAEEMEECLARVGDGALYAHRDSIAEGYLSMPGGVRVGVCGRARYEDGTVVGISEVSSLVFRIPRGGCDFKEEIEAAWRGGVERGMLIFSPPGVGKTTALRHLAWYIGSRCGRRVAVIDERCEFDPTDYSDATVDILSGYKKSDGVEIATRTLSPEVIMIDEIGAADVVPIRRVLRSGVPVVATSHASSLRDLSLRDGIGGLIEDGTFDVFVEILNTPPTYSLTVTKNGAAKGEPVTL